MNNNSGAAAGGEGGEQRRVRWGGGRSLADLEKEKSGGR
jgi:hypothetical protein